MSNPLVLMMTPFLIILCIHWLNELCESFLDYPVHFTFVRHPVSDENHDLIWLSLRTRRREKSAVLILVLESGHHHVVSVPLSDFCFFPVDVEQWHWSFLLFSLLTNFSFFKFCTPSSSQDPWKQSMSHTPLSSIFLSPNFIWRKILTRRGKWCVIRVYKKTTYRKFSQLHLINWPIRNYSSVQFLWQTLSGNTLTVGTRSIPG